MAKEIKCKICGNITEFGFEDFGDNKKYFKWLDNFESIDDKNGLAIKNKRNKLFELWVCKRCGTFWEDWPLYKEESRFGLGPSRFYKVTKELCKRTLSRCKFRLKLSIKYDEGYSKGILL